MERGAKEELVEARDALRRGLTALRLISGRTRSPCGSLPIITKLETQIHEIDELLEGEEGGNA